MRNQVICVHGTKQHNPPKTCIPDFKTVVVVVDTGQTKEQAWRWHLRKHPEDKNADIKVFHFDSQNKP